jgi:hypothetical protein
MRSPPPLEPMRSTHGVRAEARHWYADGEFNACRIFWVFLAALSGCDGECSGRTPGKFFFNFGLDDRLCGRQCEHRDAGGGGRMERRPYTCWGLDPHRLEWAGPLVPASGKAGKQEAILLAAIGEAGALAIQETHSTPGTIAAASFPQSIKAWWSHEGQSTGVVGIMVQNRFLARFTPGDEGWCEILPGRTAVPRLNGTEGALDIAVLYLRAGVAHRQRDRVRAVVASARRPATAALLSLLTGDFNFAREAEDRINLTTGERAVNDDSAEHEVRVDELLRPNGLWEAWQEEYPHRTTLGS